jgi:propionyl-CoA carboxylase alpha chain
VSRQAYCVGPAPTAQSYLNIPKIVEAIKASGAQAVSPASRAV